MFPKDVIGRIQARLFLAQPASRTWRRWLVVGFLLSLPLVVFWFWAGLVISLLLRLLLMLEGMRLGDSGTFMDERQEALRNRVYYTAYMLLSLVSIVVVAIVVIGAQSQINWIRYSWLLPNVTVIFLQLIGGLPAVHLAWFQPDEPNEEI